MVDPLTILSVIPKRIGVAADHGGFELKELAADSANKYKIAVSAEKFI